MMPRHSFVSWLFATLLVAGCTPFYVAPAMNAPLFEHGGQLHASARIESTTSSLDANGALAVTDNLAVQVGGSFGPRVKRKHGHEYGELGLGGFWPFGIFRLEAFGGMGYGKARGEIELANLTDGIMGTGDYSRVFAQLDAGFAFRYFEIGAGLRTSWVTVWHTEDSTGLRRTVREFYLEPGSFIRAGWPLLKFELAMQFVLPFGRDIDVAVSVFQMSLGLHVAFDVF